MTTDCVDLDAYFDRVHWGGSTTVSHENLAGLVDAHMKRIPFENLDVLLGRPVRLDTASLQDKMVRDRRGGYCFEHASLFAAVLDALGFAPVRHTARVVLITPRHLSPRAHMFITVHLSEGTFVVDPGFGALAPRVPVPLAEGVEVRYGNEVHWMARDEGWWVLRTRMGDKTTNCWVSTAEEDNLVDFDVGSYYVSTHPASAFVNRMMLRAITDSGRIGVMNRDVTEWRGDEVRTSIIPDRAALRALLSKDFGFDLPEVESMRVPSIPEWQ